MHLISAAVQNRDCLELPDRIPGLGFSSVLLSLPVFQDAGSCPREAGRALALVMKHFEADGLKGRWIEGVSVDSESLSHNSNLVFQTQTVPLSTEPLPRSQHSPHRNLFSATSLPAPQSPDKPDHSADEESSLSSGTNVWQVNFKVAHGVEATESYTTVKKEKCCWINSASNGCVTENTLKIQALCIRRQALWFPSRNCEGSLELGLTGVQLLLLEFCDYETCAPVSPM